MAQSVVDAGGVRLNARTKRNAHKIHAREIRIDKQRVPFEFEFVTVSAEISHAHTIAGIYVRIADDELSVGRESRSKSRRGKCQEKKKRQATTDKPDKPGSEDEHGHQTT